MINLVMSKVEKVLCEGPLTEEDCFRNPPNPPPPDLTPGNDRISFEFYQTF